jgi:hypothetical protein
MQKMIAKIKGGGTFLELWDTSKWAIRPVDVSITSAWTPDQEVKISQPIKGRSFNYKIENVDSGQNICVFALKVS